MAIPSLNIGGGKWATKQDKLLAYKQNIGGRYFAINGDTSRNSTATFTNQNALIESVGNNVARVDFKDDVKGALLLEPQSTNLINQSESFGNSYWIKSGASIQADPSTAGVEQVTNGDFASGLTGWTNVGSWTSSVETANNDGSTSGDLYRDAVEPFKLDSFYLVKFTISNYIAGTFDINIGGNVNTVDVSANGSYEYSLFMSSAPNNRISLRPRSTFNGSIDNVSVKEVQGFASPSVDSPTGAFKMIPNSASGNRYMYLSVNNALSTNSIFLKKAELSFAKVGNAAATVVVDLDLGTLSKSTDSVNDYSIESFSNDWYKISIYNKLNSNFQMHFFAGVDSTGANVSTNGADGFYIYGAQLEALPYATSYIPTNGSAVTRVKDVATNFGDVNTFNSAAGTLFFEGSFLDGSDYNTISISNDSGSDKCRLWFDNTNLVFATYVNNINQVFISLPISNNVNYKIAVKYKTNDFGLFVNGVKSPNIAVNIGGVPSINSYKKLNFNSGSIYNNLNGKVKQVQVYKTALTDSELITLTTI